MQVDTLSNIVENKKIKQFLISGAKGTIETGAFDEIIPILDAYSDSCAKGSDVWVISDKNDFVIGSNNQYIEASASENAMV